MIGFSNEDSAARRARWLAQVAVALEEASRLLELLDRMDDRNDSVALQARILAARREVLAMRLRRSAAGARDRDLTPDRSESLPWERTA